MRDFARVIGVRGVDNDADAASDSSSDSEDVDSSSETSAVLVREGGERNAGRGRRCHSSRESSHCSPWTPGFLSALVFLLLSHDIHDALLPARVRPSPSPGVRIMLFDPLDELDD